MRSPGPAPEPAALPADTAAGRPERDGRRPPGSNGTAAATENVNSPGTRASNLEVRRAEAEQDRALIEAAQKGDRAAFRQLVERHQRRAFAIALGMVRDENDARDLVQDAFLRVYRGLDRFQGGSSFFTWFYRIVTNLAIDFMRRPGRREVGLDDSRAVEAVEETDFPLISRIDGAEPLEAVHRQELGARLQAALDALPPYHRGVVMMREIEGMSYEEMAVAMNVSKGTIMSRLFHARQKLQRALADCYAEQRGKDLAPEGDDEP